MPQPVEPHYRTRPAHPGEVTTVVVRIPADVDHVALVRSAAGHIGAGLGCTLHDLTDLRLAVDEACGLFLTHPDFTGDVLECRFTTAPGLIRIRVSARSPADLEPDVDGFGWHILASLADDVSWTWSDGTLRIDVEKWHPARR